MSTLRTKILALLQRLRLKAATARRLAPTPEQWTAGSFQGLKYRLFLPLGQDESAPLLLMLHGCTQGAENFAAGTRMNALAQQAGCAVLYPEQSARANAMRCWNWFQPEVQQGRGEAARITGLVQEIVRAQALDAQRVYVAGISAGAALAEILALRFPQVFAASALHSGLRYGAAGSAGEAMRAMRSGASAPPQQTAALLKRELGVNSLTAPAMVIHGSTDGVVSTRNAAQIVALHLALAGMELSGDALPEAADDREFEAGGRQIRQRDYRSGATLLVRSLLIDGMGHAWSGGDARLPYNDASGPDASRLIIEFLLQHRLAQNRFSPQPLLAAR